MKTTRTIAMTVAMGLALSGCQMLFGQRTAKIDSANNSQLAQAGAVGHPALEQGKQLLRAGRTAQAIELLRVAQRDPDSMADASNALGVAYAKLGRHDLADRYFRMALALEPGQARFAANMLRLQRDYDLAMRRNEETEQLALRAAEEKRIAEAKIAKPGQIERLSRGEVKIQMQTVPSRVAPSAEVLAMRSNVKKDRTGVKIETALDEASVEPREKASSRVIDFSGNNTPGTAKSVAVPVAKTEGQYPVRVYFGA